MYVVEKVAELKKKNLLLIYSFCIKNLYSYLYILQNGVVNTSLLKHFQNETLPWSLWEGRARQSLPLLEMLGPDVCTAGQGVHEGSAPWLTAGNTGIPPKSPSFRDPSGLSTQQIHAASMPCSPQHWAQRLRRTKSVTDVPPLWEAKAQVIFTSNTQLEITPTT